MRRVLTTLEVLLILATIGFCAAWILVPDRIWEPLIVLLGTLLLLVEFLKRRPRQITTANRFESNGKRIKHREILRKEFRKEILQCRAEKLREDAIVRHVDRIDAYPNLNEEDSGISPWFRVALLDTYEKGIQVWLRSGGLKKNDGGYRYVDHVNGETSDISALLMGDIPYDSIEAVNMEGDDYYPYPHIYCYFDFEGEPYERLWFCEHIKQPHGHPYFKFIAAYDDVVANNPSEGTLFFG